MQAAHSLSILQRTGETVEQAPPVVRHVSLKMSEHAKKSRGTKSLLPIYVNLKTLERESGKEINRDLIEAFIFTTLRRSNDRDVESFLKGEFQIGMQEGSFFFLFDSF